MPVAYITRRAVFSAAHRLHSDSLNEVENDALYGKCNNPYGHGHNYVLEVTVKGEIDPINGMVMNLTDLKAIIERRLLSHMDHRHLNLEVPFFEGIVPTAENIAYVCWRELARELTSLYEVKIYETENNYALYRGD